MVLKVAPASSLHWSQHSVPHSPSSSQTLASAISSPSSLRRSITGSDGALFCRFVERSTLLLGSQPSSKLCRSRSFNSNRSRVRIIRRALTASLDSFSDEEFSRKIQELAQRFQLSDDDDQCDDDAIVKMDDSSESKLDNGDVKFMENRKAFDVFDDFPERDEIIPGNIERKANSVDIPFSLRIIKRKKQWQEGLIEAGESAYCSMKMAFSSMVFIIRELHCYTLQMREILFYEDLQGVLANVQKEIHASFVWLFQKVFSQTPTLMVYVMILLANYSVYSMSSNAALAASSPLQSYTSTTEEVSSSLVEDQGPASNKFDSSIVRTLKFSSSGNTASVGGNRGGGGGKHRLVASGTDGDGRFDESDHYYNSNGVLDPSRSSGDESVSNQGSKEEEMSLWNSIVEEASKMQDGVRRDESLDQETIQGLVSPVDATIEADDQSKYFKTELQYQTGLIQEPNNPLLLANYAQFLYLVAKDFDRAEEYFKRATKVEPKDAEALNKYATFLWHVRSDLWAAEETYLEAISAEPSNSYYAANYAHFLWNTGGEDTCFPLSSPDTNLEE